MRVDRIYEHRIVWDNKFSDRSSEPYGQLSFESIRAVSMKFYHTSEKVIRASMHILKFLSDMLHVRFIGNFYLKFHLIYFIYSPKSISLNTNY